MTKDKSMRAFSLRIEQDLFERALAKAESTGLTLSRHIKVLLQEDLDDGSARAMIKRLSQQVDEAFGALKLISLKDYEAAKKELK